MTPPSICLDSPAALVASLPYLLGFTPRESVILVWLHRGSVVLTQRCDLPRRWRPGELHALVEHPGIPQSDEVIAVVVSDRHDHAEVGRELGTALRARPVIVRDLLAQRGALWWSLACLEPACPCAAPRPVPDPVATAVASEFAYAGVAPASDRALLVGEVAAEPCPHLAATMRKRGIARPQTRRSRESWRDRSLAVIVPALARGTATPREQAVLCAAMADVRVRDVALWELAHLGESEQRRALTLLQSVVRASPPGMEAPVATTAALVAWLLGDGARAVIALDRATSATPDYALAAMLGAAITAGLPPSAWHAALAGLTRDECRHGRGPQERRADAPRLDRPRRDLV